MKMSVQSSLRNVYLDKIIALFNESEEVLRTAVNEISIPCIDSEGEEQWAVISVKIPTGTRDDHQPYDGYGKAEEYRMKLAEKAEKAKESAEKKAAKIERDKKMREEKKRQRMSKDVTTE